MKSAAKIREKREKDAAEGEAEGEIKEREREEIMEIVRDFSGTSINIARAFALSEKQGSHALKRKVRKCGDDNVFFPLRCA